MSNENPIIKTIKSLGIKPQRQFGQNFLIDNKIYQSEVRLAEIYKRDVILEIGPGVGILTELLLKTGNNVYALEKDLQFKEPLENLKSRYPNLKIIWGDAMDTPFPKFNKVLSNLPYKIALPLTFKIMEQDFDIGVLIYQQRLARRICAAPGQNRYCRLSVQVGRYFDAQFIRSIKPDSFYPRPKVDSALICMKKTKPKFNVASEEYFKSTLEYLFFKRNKNVKEIVSSLFSGTGHQVPRILGILKNMRNKRAATLTPVQMSIISNVLHQNKVRIPSLSEKSKRISQKKHFRNK